MPGVFKKLVLLIATALVLAGLLEVGTRLFSNLGPGLVVPDAQVGRRYIAGFQGSVWVPEAERKVDLRFDRDGFRGPDLPYDKAAGTHRIAVLGDSFVLAIATDEERTMVGQLESRLGSWDPSRRWEVMNFGASGSSTGQELAVYRAVAHRYQPDLVLCVFAVINDLADNSNRLSSGAGVYFDLDELGDVRKLPPRATGDQASGWLARHSRFYTWQKLALQNLRFHARRSARVVKPGKWIFYTGSSEDLDHAWTLTARLIETLAREVEAAGSTFALVALPAPEEIYDDRWDEILWSADEQADRFDQRHALRRLEEIANGAGIPLVTMVDRFRARAPSSSLEVEEEWLYLKGIGHLNDAGNRLAAEALFEWISDDARAEP